jgi:hypothetical protein
MPAVTGPVEVQKPVIGEAVMPAAVVAAIGEEAEEIGAAVEEAETGAVEEAETGAVVAMEGAGSFRTLPHELDQVPGRGGSSTTAARVSFAPHQFLTLTHQPGAIFVQT